MTINSKSFNKFANSLKGILMASIVLVASFALPLLTTATPVEAVASRTVTYSVAARGNITADIPTFKIQADHTLNDSRGWSRLGVKFKRVSSGGSFTLVLSEASKMPTFWSGCSTLYSCQVGRYVIINQDRWEMATIAWRKAELSLRKYRHTVVNHETGHWLGHRHATCRGTGKLAAVMQQQSINLQGCKFNSWPLGT